MSKVEPEIRNIDGEIIDFTKDDLIEKLTFESANFIRRMIAYLIDLVLIIVIWYLCTKRLFREVDDFIASLGLNNGDFTSAEKLKQFADLIGQLYLKLFLTFIFVQTLYFSLTPAIIGNGQSVGETGYGDRGCGFGNFGGNLPHKVDFSGVSGERNCRDRTDYSPNCLLFQRFFSRRFPFVT
jgi:predicted permease